MLAFIFSWIIIAIIFFSFGDALIVLFNTCCRRNEKYDVFETLVLGMCFFIIPLSIWSLWLPSNHYFMLMAMAVAGIYWIFRRRRLADVLIASKKSLEGLPPLFWIAVTLFTVTSLCCWVWMVFIPDSVFYHYQAIRWNEECAVVPGLGNLEDRLAFNSNYFLLSAVFTFRFLFGEAIYSLYYLFFLFLGYWVFYELFKSKCELKRVALLFSFVLFYVVSLKSVQNTSTDLLPNILFFSLIARFLLDFDYFNKKYLISFILPVFLLTLKLSFGVTLLIPLFLMFFLFKRKGFLIIGFVSFLSLAIIIPWLVRNIILSGYLIYPVYQVDLFSFDWKIPLQIALEQNECVKIIGDKIFDIVVTNRGVENPVGIIFLIRSIFILSVISIFMFLYNVVRKRMINSSLYVVFFTIIFTLLLWFLKGPDVRFVSGVFCVLIMLGITSFVMDGEWRSIYIKRLGIVVIILFQSFLVLWTVKFVYNQYRYVTVEAQNKTRNVCSVLYTPYSCVSRMIAEGEDMDSYYLPYQLNNGIWIYTSKGCCTFDKFPCTTETDCNWKFCDYKRLEARGSSLEDGFRMKEE